MFNRLRTISSYNAGILGVVIAMIISCGQNSSSQNSDNLIDDSDCDNPDADIECCFVNMPSSVSHIMQIADKKEEGKRMVISGTVFKSDSITAFPDVIIYAYHTDNTGLYTKNGNESGVQKWHGRLHGWCKTDQNGHYEIHSIRPARYPGDQIPAHIHAAIREPGNDSYWISDFVFSDDKLIDDRYISNLNMPGGTGVVELKMSSEDLSVGKRDIIIAGQ